MKNLLLAFLAVLCFSVSNAQTDSLRMYLDNLFGTLDKTQVPSGYLNEYGPDVVEKKWVTGVLADSNFIYDIDIFNLLYNDIENSKINPATPAMKPKFKRVLR